MIERILKAKAWQIFMISFGLPILLQIVSLEVILVNSTNVLVFNYMTIISLIFMFGFFLWFWAMAIGLQRKIPDHLKMNIGLFNVFLLIPTLYFLMITRPFNSFSGGIPSFMMGIILIPHLFSMACVFYCMGFAAKALKTAELQRKVSFSDYAGDFFLIWFFPIGIWILQPKINKIYNRELN